MQSVGALEAAWIPTISEFGPSDLTASSVEVFRTMSGSGRNTLGDRVHRTDERDQQAEI
jgi:hypothetical protein